MLLLVFLLCLLFGGGVLFGIFSYSLSYRLRDSLAVATLGLSSVLAILFEIMPRGGGVVDHCASMVHANWPWPVLLIYSALLFMAVFLLHSYQFFLRLLYFIWISLPLALAPWWLKIYCLSGSAILMDTIQAWVLIVTFPIVAILLGIVLFISLLISTWKNQQLVLPSSALFVMFLLLQQHAGDWLLILLDP